MLMGGMVCAVAQASWWPWSSSTPKASETPLDRQEQARLRIEVFRDWPYLYDGDLAYEQSYSLVDFMVDSYGWHNMAELLESLGKQQEWQAAVADVYQEYGLDWPAIQSEWQAGLN